MMWSCAAGPTAWCCGVTCGRCWRRGCRRVRRRRGRRRREEGGGRREEGGGRAGAGRAAGCCWPLYQAGVRWSCSARTRACPDPTPTANRQLTGILEFGCKVTHADMDAEPAPQGAQEAGQPQQHQEEGQAAPGAMAQLTLSRTAASGGEAEEVVLARARHVIAADGYFSRVRRTVRVGVWEAGRMPLCGRGAHADVGGCLLQGSRLLVAYAAETHGRDADLRRSYGWRGAVTGTASASIRVVQAARTAPSSSTFPLAQQILPAPTRPAPPRPATQVCAGGGSDPAALAGEMPAFMGVALWRGSITRAELAAAGVPLPVRAAGAGVGACASTSGHRLVSACTPRNGPKRVSGQVGSKPITPQPHQPPPPIRRLWYPTTTRRARSRSHSQACLDPAHDSEALRRTHMWSPATPDSPLRGPPSRGLLIYPARNTAGPVGSGGSQVRADTHMSEHTLSLRFVFLVLFNT